jgi:hypothetical protein
MKISAHPRSRRPLFNLAFHLRHDGLRLGHAVELV